MDHLGAGVGLLIVVGQRHGIKFAHGIVALQNAARIFPGDGGAGLDLRPGNFGVLARALAALGDEVVDAAFAFFVARIPVLTVEYLIVRIIQRDQFHTAACS